MLKIQNDITKEKYLQEHNINIELNKNINDSKINKKNSDVTKDDH